jgi:hypothetical protein
MWPVDPSKRVLVAINLLQISAKVLILRVQMLQWFLLTFGVLKQSKGALVGGKYFRW